MYLILRFRVHIASDMYTILHFRVHVIHVVYAISGFCKHNTIRVKPYMDFFDTLSRQLGAPGEFARAYVIAHEVGHHVQTLLGTTQKVDALRGRISQREQNALSVRVELQADCYAGIWAHQSQRAKQWLEQGDLESAINAAAQIGDDHLQREQSGVARPDIFTHGTSAQRQRWFLTGYKSGSVAACDTFGAQSL